MNSKLKKALALCLIICLCVSLASCKDNSEYGKINQVKIADSSSQEQDKYNVFTKLDSPYEYTYKSLKNKKGKLKFDVPSTWNVNVLNSSYITLNTPTKDGYLPSTRINVMFRYGEQTDDLTMTQESVRGNAHGFSVYFKEQLKGSSFYLNGRTYKLRDYKGESEILNQPSYAKDGHKKDAATLVYDKDTFVTTNNIGIYKSATLVCTYVRWQHYPICFATAVEPKYKKKAVKMLEYLASSITYEKQESLPVQEVKYDNVKFKVPETFVKHESAGNVYKAGIDTLDSSAGMSVGVFEIGDDTVKLNSDNIVLNYGPNAAKFMLNDANNYQVDFVDNSQNTNTLKIAGAKQYFPCNVVLTVRSDMSSYATNVNADIAHYIADFYTKELKGKTYLIITIYQMPQETLGKALGKTVLNTLHR